MGGYTTSHLSGLLSKGRHRAGVRLSAGPGTQTTATFQANSLPGPTFTPRLSSRARSSRVPWAPTGPLLEGLLPAASHRPPFSWPCLPVSLDLLSGRTLLLICPFVVMTPWASTWTPCIRLCADGSRMRLQQQRCSEGGVLWVSWHPCGHHRAGWAATVSCGRWDGLTGLPEASSRPHTPSSMAATPALSVPFQAVGEGAACRDPGPGTVIVHPVCWRGLSFSTFNGAAYCPASGHGAIRTRFSVPALSSRENLMPAPAERRALAHTSPRRAPGPQLEASREACPCRDAEAWFRASPTHSSVGAPVPGLAALLWLSSSCGRWATPLSQPQGRPERPQLPV